MAIRESSSFNRELALGLIQPWLFFSSTMVQVTSRAWLIQSKNSVMSSRGYPVQQTLTMHPYVKLHLPTCSDHDSYRRRSSYFQGRVLSTLRLIAYQSVVCLSPSMTTSSLESRTSAYVSGCRSSLHHLQNPLRRVV